MGFLDFLVRGVMIPGIWIFIFTEVPECNDILKGFLRLVKRRRRIKRKKRIIQTYTRPMVVRSNNSLQYRDYYDVV